MIVGLCWDCLGSFGTGDLKPEPCVYPKCKGFLKTVPPIPRIWERENKRNVPVQRDNFAYPMSNIRARACINLEKHTIAIGSNDTKNCSLWLSWYNLRIVPWWFRFDIKHGSMIRGFSVDAVASRQQIPQCRLHSWDLYSKDCTRKTWCKLRFAP